VIHVERSFDPTARVYVSPKSRAGIRKVPIASVLREHLIAHKLRAGRLNGLLFATSTGEPFDPWATKNRADKAWRTVGPSPIGLHESRHTFASLIIAAGEQVSPRATFRSRVSRRQPESQNPTGRHHPLRMTVSSGMSLEDPMM
jgi:integrase